jgi:hypothetical protein
VQTVISLVSITSGVWIANGSFKKNKEAEQRQWERNQKATYEQWLRDQKKNEWRKVIDEIFSFKCRWVLKKIELGQVKGLETEPNESLKRELKNAYKTELVDIYESIRTSFFIEPKYAYELGVKVQNFIIVSLANDDIRDDTIKLSRLFDDIEEEARDFAFKDLGIKEVSFS